MAYGALITWVAVQELILSFHKKGIGFRVLWELQ